MFSYLLLLAAPVQASTSLEPTGKWHVEYADNMCILSREYGSADRPLSIGFKPSPMSDRLQLILLRTGEGRARYEQTRLSVNGTPLPERLGLSFMSKGSTRRVTSVDLQRSEVEPLGKSGALSIAVGKEKVTLAFSRFELALESLGKCEANLLEHWGMSREVQASIAVKPEPKRSLASYIFSGDYPFQALRTRQQGASGVRFLVGTDGMPRDCKITEPSGSALLDQTTCSIMERRARFTPATDRDGKPVASLYFTRVRWVLPSY